MSSAFDFCFCILQTEIFFHFVFRFVFVDRAQCNRMGTIVAEMVNNTLFIHIVCRFFWKKSKFCAFDGILLKHYFR